jgi:hypothetical protein
MFRCDIFYHIGLSRYISLAVFDPKNRLVSKLGN